MKSRTLGLMIALLLLTPALSGGGPQEIIRRLTEAELNAVNKFFALQLEEATQAFDAGNVARAKQIVDATEALYPTSPLRQKFYQLREKCTQHYLRTEVLVGEAEVKNRVLTSGEQAIVTFRLRNVGTDPITIPTHITTEENFLLPNTVQTNNEIQVRYAEYVYTLGAQSSDKHTQLLDFDDEIQLGPGEEWEETFEFDTTLRSVADATTTQIVITGTFLPLFVHTPDGLKQYRRFTLAPATVIVMPTGWTTYVNRDDPLKSLTNGIASGNEMAIFYSAALIPKEKRDAAAKALVVGLSRSPEKHRKRGIVLMSALSQISGKYFGLKRDRWFEWWTRQLALMERESKKEGPL